MTVKERERLHLLATLGTYGPLSGVDVVRIANSECSHDAFDDLPELRPRGITNKLNGLALSGLVTGDWPGDGRPMVWDVTDKGRNVLRRSIAKLTPREARAQTDRAEHGTQGKDQR